MSTIHIQNLSYHVPGKQLFDSVSCKIGHQDAICLVGRNGEGKSTFLKILTGTTQPDSGTIQIDKGAKISYLPQEVPQNLTGSVFDCVAEGLGSLGTALKRYQHLSDEIAQSPASAQKLQELTTLQQQIESQQGWDVRYRVLNIIERCQLNASNLVESLSGGLKRRVLLAKALIQDPDVLLLDEPTNHLDITSIEWLETFLKNYPKTFIVVTHDRRLIEAVAKRILDIDRGKLFSWECNYTQYLERKQAVLESEEKHNAEFDKHLAQEETWIRQGIKARRTRNEGRVRNLEKLREERKKRREVMGQVKFSTPESNTSGQLVIETKHLSFKYQDQWIINDFSTLIMRGDRIGIVGPNGCGKTTLIRLLLKQLEPTTGTVRLGTNLDIAYFDQLKATIKEDESAEINVGEGQTFLTLPQQKIHIFGYLQQFLFTPERARMPARGLSGGERSRLLLAKLFSKPSNLLVLDEPTNDLDMDTLDLLEELIADYKGTVLCISHDRSFLNNIATSIIAYEGPGLFRETIGGYDDWMRQQTTRSPDKKQAQTIEKLEPLKPQKTTTKLSYKDQRELDALPNQIEALEKQIQSLQQQLGDPAFYQTGSEAAIKEKNKQLAELSEMLENAYWRWEELTSKSEK